MIHLKIAKHKKLHTVIVAGGNCNLKEYSDMLAEAFLIGADRGALMLVDAGYNVDLAVGDFDSVSQLSKSILNFCLLHKPVIES